MHFKSFDELLLWAKITEAHYIHCGNQGKCFKIGNKVYKIFVQFFDEDNEDMITYNKDDIMRFSSINNNTFIWPEDIIYVNDIVVGYITNYVDAIDLCDIDPLNVSLDKFDRCLESTEEDLKIISNNGVKTFDVMYNIMYGVDGFKIVDSLEYSKTDIDPYRLYRLNRRGFYMGVKLFLISEYFDEFVDNSKMLLDLYDDDDANIVEFLREFRKQLSDREGYNITRLGDARKSLNVRKIVKPVYIRGSHRFIVD